MSTTTALRRLTAAAALTTAALLTTLAIAASPAFAADPAQVNLSGVSSNATTGRFDAVTATVVNKSNTNLVNIHGVFTIHLDGMPTDGVRVIRTFGGDLPAESAGDATVRLSDAATFELPRGFRRSLSYQLQFTLTAPTGRATVTYEVYDGSTRLGGDSASVSVKGSATPHTTPPTSPPNSDPGVLPSFAAGPSYSLAPLGGDENSISNDVPVSLYVMGALLVGVGGVILWLIFRRQRPLKDAGAYPTAEYDQVRPASLGYPRHSASAGGQHATSDQQATGGPRGAGTPPTQVLRPTAILPALPDPDPPARPRHDSPTWPGPGPFGGPPPRPPSPPRP